MLSGISKKYIPREKLSSVCLMIYLVQPKVSRSVRPGYETIVCPGFAIGFVAKFSLCF